MSQSQQDRQPKNKVKPAVMADPEVTLSRQAATI